MSKNKSLKKFIILFLVIGTILINIPLNPKVKINQKSTLNLKTSSTSYCLEWEDIWGGSSAEYGRGGIAIDNNGSIYITGDTYSFGSGGYDIYIIKYDTNGNKIWTRFWGTSTHETAHDIALDSSGDIYVTGHIGESGYSMLLLKYDSNGNYQWHSIWGQATWDEGYGVIVDEFGNIYVTGRTMDDFVLWKFDSLGSLIWSKINTNLQSGLVISKDESGFIYTSGTDGNNVYLSKYYPNGTIIWNRCWGGEDTEWVHDIAVDNSSNIYLAGGTYSYGAGEIDTYIIKYNCTGTKLWNTIWGTPYNEMCFGIALDDLGNIFLTGYIFLPGETNKTDHKRDTFIAKFDCNGTLVWLDTWGGLEYDDGYGIALDMNGSIYVTGSTNSFGAGDSDIFILKYSSCKTQIPPNLIGFSIIELSWFIVIFLFGIMCFLLKKKRIKIVSVKNL